MLKRAGLLAVLMMGSMPASATTVFAGHDDNDGAVMSSSPVAAAANAAFLADLTDIRSASFEGSGAGARPAAITFEGTAGSTDAVLSGAAFVMGSAPRSSPYASGTFATDGSNFLQLEQSSFTINFDQPVSGLGFYAIDVESDALAILTLASGDTETYSFDSLFNSANAGSGSIDFLGFTSLLGIRSLTLSHAAMSDTLGFDDFQIGSSNVLQAAAVGEVPETATWAMFIAGFGLVGSAMRRRKPSAMRFA
jgi:hypothetical protein